jgi:hypothetical protein
LESFAFAISEEGGRYAEEVGLSESRGAVAQLVLSGPKENFSEVPVMNGTPRVTLSAAAVVVICFFLPWLQVSCAGLKDSATGMDLARGGDGELWLIPLLMFGIILLALGRVWKQRPVSFALLSIASGLLSAYLMNRERVDAEETSGLLGTRLTGWFWLALFSSLVVAGSALWSHLRRTRST